MANYHFIGGDGKSYGPYSAEQMRLFMGQNRLTAQSQVSADGDQWQAVSNYPDLMGPTGAPAGMPMYQNYQKPHRGTLILVLGILGLFCGWLTAIPAWVMANNDLKEMDQGIMDPSGRGSTKAGKICGIVSIIIGCICGLGYGAFMILALSAGA